MILTSFSVCSCFISVACCEIHLLWSDQLYFLSPFTAPMSKKLPLNFGCTSKSKYVSFCNALSSVFEAFSCGNTCIMYSSWLISTVTPMPLLWIQRISANEIHVNDCRTLQPLTASVTTSYINFPALRIPSGVSFSSPSSIMLGQHFPVLFFICGLGMWMHCLMLL